MSNFALGRLVRMLILFVCGFIVTYYGVVAAKVVMKEDEHRMVSFIAGVVMAAVGKRHT
jgi:hypothetical protein